MSMLERTILKRLRAFLDGPAVQPTAALADPAAGVHSERSRVSRAKPITTQPGGGAAADADSAQATLNTAEIARAARAARDLAALGIGLGLDTRQATARACDALAAQGGIDLRSAIGLPATPPEARTGCRVHAVAAEDVARASAWLAATGCSVCTAAELVAGAQLGDPSSHSARSTAGRILRGLGWHARRCRIPGSGQSNVYRKPAAH